MSVQASLDQQWARISGRLKDEVGETAYRSWLKPLTVEDFIGGQVRIVVPTRFMRDWIRTHYADRIRALWTGENPGVQSVEIVVAPPRNDASLGGALTTGPRAAANAIADAGLLAETGIDHLPTYGEVQASASLNGGLHGGLNGVAEAPALPAFIAGNGLGEERDDVSALLDPRFTFENFVVGKPNELAFAAARRVADANAVTFNPLFLYGGVGLGKTHLMHAIAWHIRKKDPARRVIYLSAEKFMYQFIRALRYKDTMAFKEQFRSVDVLMIDDVQFISGKDSTQEEFFHTFNALVDQNRQVIISADKSPSDLEGMEERLRSRLGWGLVADIHPTTYELRLGILQSKGEQMRVQIPQKVLEFLAHKITSNVRELEGALNRIVAHAELVGRAITLESSQEVLHDLLRASNRRVTIEEIQKKVAEHYNIRLADMSSARRARAVARPRQVAMYLSKQLTARSLPEIGRKFGDRDHTTVMHAVRKVEELCATDPTFSEDVELLRRMLEG
ncbi:chromosomal replication initiator protein DnaA [Nitrospirillum viridazoti Y2]|uniref:Chromosomal replication initiator protein DnaA n=1 Tax=Nitrospirillum amazonense TaxID=28077 RepID=A0A560I7U8_9PROT|nr:chromosomal replication initiator protein DnaA [Nitrospirillum amazonense]EGY01120.1 chromosomal replication initiator protein DnaA [Nitrospirillum amazonense Y2]TWB54485.1 chromosomal replication initiator protein DnaA [Nitrospirillum amazonense]